MKIRTLLLATAAAASLLTANLFGRGGVHDPLALDPRLPPISPRRRGWNKGRVPDPRHPPSKVLLRQIAKERAIGIDPKYRNRRSENDKGVQLDWLVRSEQWDKANPMKVS